MKRWFNVIRCCGNAVLSIAMLGLVAGQKAEDAGEATGEALEEAGKPYRVPRTRGRTNWNTEAAAP